MAFFVGGQPVLAAAIVPVERRSPDRERTRAAARRFGYGTLVQGAVCAASLAIVILGLVIAHTARSAPGRAAPRP